MKGEKAIASSHIYMYSHAVEICCSNCSVLLDHTSELLTNGLLLSQYPEVVAHHDNMADHPKIREYLARGERKDEFMPEWTNKIDLPRGSWSAAA
jgi:hypothetical protein